MEAIKLKLIKVILSSISQVVLINNPYTGLFILVDCCSELESRNQCHDCKCNDLDIGTIYELHKRRNRKWISRV